MSDIFSFSTFTLSTRLALFIGEEVVQVENPSLVFPPSWTDTFATWSAPFISFYIHVCWNTNKTHITPCCVNSVPSLMYFCKWIRPGIGLLSFYCGESFYWITGWLCILVYCPQPTQVPINYLLSDLKSYCLRVFLIEELLFQMPPTDFLHLSRQPHKSANTIFVFAATSFKHCWQHLLPLFFGYCLKYFSLQFCDKPRRYNWPADRRTNLDIKNTSFHCFRFPKFILVLFALPITPQSWFIRALVVTGSPNPFTSIKCRLSSSV